MDNGEYPSFVETRFSPAVSDPFTQAYRAALIGIHRVKLLINLLYVVCLVERWRDVLLEAVDFLPAQHPVLIRVHHHELIIHNLHKRGLVHVCSAIVIKRF